MEAHGQLPERQANVMSTFQACAWIAKTLLLIKYINKYLRQSLGLAPESGVRRLQVQ
jgi:hypothetical protein